MWSARRQLKARAAKRRPAFFCKIELNSLLGMLITLLIVFMVVPPPPHHGNPVDLVRSSHATYQPRAIREDALHVWITSDGTVYFGNTRISPDELSQRIRAGLRNGIQRRVYVAVDARARYGQVATVVDGARLAGLDNITFISE